MYFDEKMLRKQIVLDYVDEKKIVRVVGRDQSVAWYACEGALGKEAQWIESTEKCMLNIYN